MEELQSGVGLASKLSDMPRKGAETQLDSVLVEQSGKMSLLLMEALRDIRYGALPREACVKRERQARHLWRRDLLVLAALTGVAPLLGLLGTVSGMIFTFDAVAATAGDTASRVAEGVSTALITTQFGLIIALPGIFGMARLQRLIQAVEVKFAECRSLMLLVLDNQPEGRTA